MTQQQQTTDSTVMRELLALFIVLFGIAGVIVFCGMIAGWPGVGLLFSVVLIVVGYRLGVSKTGKE